MNSFLEDFKKFAMRGNVIDLAVAVVIGGAFGKIVSSLVADIVTPLLGILLGGIDFTGLTFSAGDAIITYGVFLQNVFDFLVIAMAIFVALRLLAKFQEEEKAPEPAEPAPEPEDIQLLREIRDSLRR